jgi:hypothetical protein
VKGRAWNSPEAHADSDQGQGKEDVAEGGAEKNEKEEGGGAGRDFQRPYP